MDLFTGTINYTIPENIQTAIRREAVRRKWTVNEVIDHALNERFGKLLEINERVQRQRPSDAEVRRTLTPSIRPLTVRELCELTGLTQPTVNVSLRSLMMAGQVEETAPAKVNGGRFARTYSITLEGMRYSLADKLFNNPAERAATEQTIEDLEKKAQARATERERIDRLIAEDAERRESARRALQPAASEEG